MEDKYLQDISDIKNMMNKSSQFISLSGLGGIMAGVYALIGAYIGHELIQNNDNDIITLESPTFKWLLLTSFIVLVLSVGTAFSLTISKAKREKETVWTSASKRLFINFLIPLVTGAIFCLLLLRDKNYSLIAPVTLIFYGLACVNASKYTLRDVRYLGITIIIIGLISTGLSDYALEFWALGFGICHIIYGGMMYFKYDKG